VSGVTPVLRDFGEAVCAVLNLAVVAQARLTPGTLWKAMRSATCQGRRLAFDDDGWGGPLFDAGDASGEGGSGACGGRMERLVAESLREAKSS